MLTSGDVVDLDLGVPEGREAGYRHPAVVLTAQDVLDGGPTVIQVAPMTSTLRGSRTEVAVEPDGANGLDHLSAIQVQHLRGIAPSRILATRGNVGALMLTQAREIAGLLLDVPR